MLIRAYVLEPDLGERARLEAALSSLVDEVVPIDHDGLRRFTREDGGIVIASTEPDEARTLGVVQDLRARGVMLPVLVLGTHRAFRTAVDVARFDATDFLERPVTLRQLRAAVIRLLEPMRQRSR